MRIFDWLTGIVRCQSCNQIIKKDYYSVSNDEGMRYWCSSCAKTDLEIGKHLHKMGRMSTLKQRIAKKIHSLLDNESNGA